MRLSHNTSTTLAGALVGVMVGCLFWAIVAFALAVVSGCAAANDAAGGDDSGGIGDDGGAPGDDGANPSGDDGGIAGCMARPSSSPAPAVTPAIYPAPRLLTVGMLGASIATVCVDTSALPQHTHLDALVPRLLGDAGLTAASGCACDYAITFTTMPPALSADDAALLAASSSSERHALTVQSVDGRGVAQLWAASERGALYALRAALALVEPDPADAKAKRVADATVVDWPSFGERGVLEGIYGPNSYCDASTMDFLPWRVADRGQLLSLMSRLRENTFVYGPKCDPYARAQWRTLYPSGSSDEDVIRVAIHQADQELLEFVWSISPGGDYNFASPASDWQSLTAKIDSMIGLGVKHFALFLDDIADHSAGPQVGLINQLDDYVKQKLPGEHLLVVGTTYCSDPSNTFNCGGPNAYTDTMGAQVHSDVEILWTGASVEPSTMSAADMKAIDASLKRPVTIWDNWPNAPGGFTGRSADLPGAVRGYFSNPVLNEYPGPANPPATFFAALGPIADYLWMSDRYAKNPSASYQAWQPIDPKQACAPCGANSPGWTCDPSTKNQILFCDYTTKCLSALPCPGGCASKPAGTPDECN
jgi:hyaluronoglucosaminidase